MKTKKQVKDILDQCCGQTSDKPENTIAALELEKEDVGYAFEVLSEKYQVEPLIQFLEVLTSAQNELNELPTPDLELLTAASPEALAEEYTHRVLNYYEKTKDVPGDIKAFRFICSNIGHDELGMQEFVGLLRLQNDSIDNRLLSIVSRRPKKYVLSVDNITQSLAALAPKNELFMGKRGTQPVMTAVAIDCPPHMMIDGNIHMTAYDKSIVNAVSSVIEAGNTTFTIPMLYHAMTGKENPTVDSGLLEEITHKIDKLRRMTLSIDITNEINANFFDSSAICEDFIIEGYLLPLNKISAKVNGKKTEVYQILDTPPLYKYAKSKKQIATVPINLLNAPLNNNATTIPLKNYLLGRIEGIRNAKNYLSSSKILYESIYKELGETEAGKVRKKRIRDYTTVILNYFAQEGYITSYHETKKGRCIDGVTIDV